MNPPQPDASRPKSPIPRPAWRKKKCRWRALAKGILILLACAPFGIWLIVFLGVQTYFYGGKSEADLATGKLRRTEYRFFFKISSVERETELSRLAAAAGYPPTGSQWVHCKSQAQLGPTKFFTNGWDMSADNDIIQAGAWASFAMERGRPKPLEWYQRVFDLLKRRDYARLWTELDEEMQAGIRAP